MRRSRSFSQYPSGFSFSMHKAYMCDSHVSKWLAATEDLAVVGDTVAHECVSLRCGKDGGVMTCAHDVAAS